MEYSFYFTLSRIFSNILYTPKPMQAPTVLLKTSSTSHQPKWKTNWISSILPETSAAHKAMCLNFLIFEKHNGTEKPKGINNAIFKIMSWAWLKSKCLNKLTYSQKGCRSIFLWSADGSLVRSVMYKINRTDNKNITLQIRFLFITPFQSFLSIRTVSSTHYGNNLFTLPHFSA